MISTQTATNWKFPFFYEERRGLARVETAMHIAELSEDGVTELIDDGVLIAFNLASAGAKVRLPCIWCRSLVAYVETKDGSASHPHLASTEEVLADILPSGQRPLRGGELMRILAIKSALLHAHIKAGALAVVDGTMRPGKSPLIPRPSIAAFLAERRMR
jgi:hypothetical protein